ncbi:eukaryotic-like serine/threonine-protein kinase [Frankia sp. AiPs1]|uniref:serine/threonine-protein kinase n=1 Tax=Frankia sp. AiPa1 TaxID=573492 RepID=UPI00202B5E98|nr:serine/threonine-protein kinase [Frankia sp. AiPa1]MCL9759791.1 serine/threonine protein kinase [Frankia sp. AiPa1]
MEALRPDDPESIGDYRLLARLGAGGMGRVYLGRSSGGRTVAIKVIRAEFAEEPQFRYRFRREVDAARRVAGMWTAPVLDADPDAEQPWLVTTFVPGPSLHDAVREHGPLPVGTVRALGAGLAEALMAVHGAGLVHRDLKPSNVLLSLDGPKVIDFGISRAVDATVLTHTGAAVGSPAYMAPEQIGTGEIGPATDVFALGIVLAYAATGEPPFRAPSLPALMYAILSHEPDLSQVPDELADLVARCLHKDPGQRPAPAQVLARLAPATPAAGGAAALVAAGWLPPDLVTALSRSALALLDLDAPTRSQPVPSTFVVHSPPGSLPAPPPMPVAAPSPSQPRSRRTGLAFAGATVPVLALVLTILLIGLRSGDHDRTAGAGASATSGTSGSDRFVVSGPASPPRSTPGSAATAPGDSGGTSRTGEDAVPDAYLGTWQGVISDSSSLSQNVNMTVRAGRIGETIVHSEVSTDAFVATTGQKVTCLSDMRLTSASDGITLVDVPGSGGTSEPTLLGLPLCTHGGQVTLQVQPGGTVRYTSAIPGTANPTGILARTR